MPPNGGLVRMTSTRSDGGVAGVRFGERVVVTDVHRHFDAVQEHVGDAEQMRHGLLLDATNGFLEVLLVGGRLDFALADVFERTGEKPAGAAGGVEDEFAEARIGHFDHELGDGARGVILARVASALEVTQYLLVDVAEQVAVLRSC